MPTSAMDVGAAWADIGSNLFKGQQYYEIGKTRMAKELANQAMMGAHARAYNAKAAIDEQRAQYQTPEFGKQFAAAAAGLGDDWETALPTVAPDVRSKYQAALSSFLGNLGATGDTNAEQLAKAFGVYQKEGRISDAISDPRKAADFGRAMAASEGKALFHQGANGVMDQFSGVETLNDVGRSAAMENRAQAGNAAASAALHRAQIPEVQSRIDLNRSKMTQEETITNPDGSVTVVKPAAKPGKAPTEFQGKSALYGARAKEAHDIMTALEAITGPGAYNRLAATAAGGNGMLNTIANPMMSDATQKAVQAQRDFINAVLRQESGAAIAQSEFDNAVRQYFPQPGDKPHVLAQKRRNRETAIKGFINSAGNAAFDAPEMNRAPTATAKPDAATVLSEAKAAIAAGAPRAAVIKRLKEMGIHEGGI